MFAIVPFVPQGLDGLGMATHVNTLLGLCPVHAGEFLYVQK